MVTFGVGCYLNANSVSDLLHSLEDFIIAGLPDSNRGAEKLVTSVAV